MKSRTADGPESAHDGDPAAIRLAAHWLDPEVYGPLQDADYELVSTVMWAEQGWTGQAGSAFNSTTQAIRRGNLDVPTYAQDVAEIMRAYAGRLERGAEDFAGHAKTATSKGLSVWNNVISKPTTSLRYCPDPNGDDTEAIAEYDRYLAKLKTYNDLSTKVGTWWGELDVWVTEHFMKLIGDVEKLKEASHILDTLRTTNEQVVNVALETTSVRMERDLASFRSQAASLQEQAETLRRQLRSGNPALRAAAEAADPKDLRRAANALSESISGVSRASKIIPVVGVVIDIVSTGKAIADGESGTSALAGLGGSIAGGAIAGAATPVIAGAVGVAIPPVGVAIIVVAASIAVGEAATWLWEAEVPLDTREAMDDGLSDAWDWVNPFD